MNWAKLELAESQSQKRCTPSIASWILSVVDRALREEYGYDYSIRCLQASECVSSILTEIGIKNCLCVGALCALTVYTGQPQTYGWSGFWEDDHHVWVVTEYGELVDLTISQLHLHPATRSDVYPIPALWWHSVHEMPSILKYLYKDIIKTQLPTKEMDVLDRIRNNAISIFNDELACDYVPEKPEFPIIYDLNSLNYLCQTDHQWTSQAFIAQQMEIQLPPWVAQRELELLKQYR